MSKFGLEIHADIIAGNNEKVKKAALFMHNAHKGQSRKYNGGPYSVHPLQVYQLVRKCCSSSEDMLVAALLHDVVEDTDRTITDIQLEFGDRVSGLVEDLTNIFTVKSYPDIKRQERKELEWKRLATISQDAKFIKLCDRTCNIIDLYKDAVYDKKAADFLPTYIRESKQMVEYLLAGWSLIHDEKIVLTILYQLLDM